jgi:hypothetical protein
LSASEYDDFSFEMEQQNQERLKEELKDAERRKRTHDFHMQLLDSLDSANAIDKRHIQKQLGLIEILAAAESSNGNSNGSKSYLMHVFKSKPALFKDGNGEVMSPIQAAHYNCSKFFSTFDKSEEKEIYRQCKESGWSKRTKRQDFNSSNKKVDTDELMRRLAETSKIGNSRSDLFFSRILKEDYFVFIMGFACPLIIFAVWKGVKWVGGRFSLDDQSNLNPTSNEDKIQDIDLGKKPVLTTRRFMGDLDVEFAPTPDGIDAANTTPNKPSVKHAPLWAAGVIFSQLCFYAGLIFLFNAIATKELLKISLIIFEKLLIVPILLACIYPSIRLNQMFLRNSPKCQPFAWGYFSSLAVITIGVSGAILGVWFYSDDGAGLIIWSAFLIALGTLLYKRNLWAWVVFTVLSLNPASWIINWIYLKNRWQEMKEHER